MLTINLNSLSATVNSYHYIEKRSNWGVCAEIASFDGARGVSNFQTFFPEAFNEPRAQFSTLFFPTHFLPWLFVSHNAISIRIAPSISCCQCCTKLCGRCDGTLITTDIKLKRSYEITWWTRFRSVILQVRINTRRQMLMRYLALVARLSEQQFRVVEHKRSSRIQPGSKT